MHRGGALTRLSDPMPCRAEPTDRSSGAETAQPGGQHVLDPSVHAHGGGGIGPRRPVVDDHHRLLGPNRRPHEAQPGPHRQARPSTSRVRAPARTSKAALTVSRRADSPKNTTSGLRMPPHSGHGGYRKLLVRSTSASPSGAWAASAARSGSRAANSGVMLSIR